MADETAVAARPELKSFEDAAKAFMDQATANEYGSSGDDGSGTPERQYPKEKAPPQQTAKPVEKAPEKPAADSRRAPDALFKKDEAKPDGERPVESEIDKIEAPEFKDPAKSGQWDSLKTKAKEWEKKAREFEQKLSGSPDTEKTLAELKASIADRDKKLSEMSAIVERANVEAHPDFRKKYIEGRESLVSRAKTIVSDAGGEADEIAIALSLSGKARVEAIEKAAETLSTFQQGRLAKVIDELELLDVEAASKREKSGDAWKEIQREQQEHAQREQEEFAAKALKSHEMVKREMERELEVLREVPGTDWWNEQRKSIIERADKFYAENTDVREGSKAAIWREAGPVYRDLYVEERKHSDGLAAKLSDAEKALTEAYGSGPRATGRTGDGPKSKQSMTFEERVALGE